MSRHTRYQAFIVENDAVLLIKHSEHETERAYWVIPGGGINDHESETECVVREALEETNLQVEVERLLLDEPGHPDGVYPWRKTFLCRPVGGRAAPGIEPEQEAAARYSIVDVRWLDLRDESGWDDELAGRSLHVPAARSSQEGTWLRAWCVRLEKGRSCS